MSPPYLGSLEDSRAFESQVRRAPGCEKCHQFCGIVCRPTPNDGGLRPFGKCSLYRFREYPGRVALREMMLRRLRHVTIQHWKMCPTIPARGRVSCDSSLKPDGLGWQSLACDAIPLFPATRAAVADIGVFSHYGWCDGTGTHRETLGSGQQWFRKV